MPGRWGEPEAGGGGSELVANKATILATENTTSAAYVALTSPGPEVVIEVGPSGMLEVTLTVQSRNTNAGSGARASFALAGANTLAANDDNAIYTGAAVAETHSKTVLLTGLTPGATTVTMLFKADANTAEFARRFLVVKTW